MSDFTVLTYLGKKLMSIDGFDHYPDASQFVFNQQQTTQGLKFYIVNVLAMSKSKED